MSRARPRTWPEVVKLYRRDHRGAAKELEFWRRRRPIKDAIRAAVLSRNEDGKKYSHQWRIPKRVLLEAADRLSAAVSELRASRDFDELIQVVYERAGSVDGIGDLAVYDVALRIGARLGRLPERVYLHAGTREGARTLGLNVRGRASIEMDELPRELRALKAWEVEDVLCIYRDEFALLRKSITLR
jgi:hypothetical protein